MRKFIIWLFIFLIALIILLLVGSRPSRFDESPNIVHNDLSLAELDALLKNEHGFNIKAGNEAQIIWADSRHQKTPFSIVYLHGFTASHHEGHPLHRALAKRFGANLYLARLADHGLVTNDPLAEMTASRLLSSAKKAMQVGQSLGDDVIVIGTSTGATLAIYLAAANPELIDILLFYAPNINVADPRSFLLTYPWGEALAKFLEGEFMSHGNDSPLFSKYWYSDYKTSSLVELLSLIEHTMTSDVFAQIHQPTFISYYYKSESEKDQAISTDGIQQFYSEIGTSAELKSIHTTPNSGNHVTISPITSQDILSPFEQASTFLKNVCFLPVVDSTSSEILLGLQSN